MLHKRELILNGRKRGQTPSSKLVNHVAGAIRHKIQNTSFSNFFIELEVGLDLFRDGMT